MVDVAALEYFYLHTSFECVETDTARDCIVFNLFLFLFSRRRRNAACYRLLGKCWLFKFEGVDWVDYVSDLLLRPQRLTVFINRLWFLETLIAIIEVLLTILIGVVIYVLVLVIHLVEPCVELLLMSGIDSLAIHSDVYSSVRLHAALVQGYVNTAAYAEALK